MKILELPRYLILQTPPLDLRELGYGREPRETGIAALKRFVPNLVRNP